MIKSEHQRWADFLFRLYIYPAFRRQFHGFRLLGEFADFDPETPLILLPNHSTWWDGFFFYFIQKHLLKRPGRLMMLEKQLCRNRFFRYIGAYSVNPETIRGVRESLRYTLDILERPDAPAICLFPQGELQPSRIELQFRSGIEWVQKHLASPCQLCTLGIRIEFGNEQRPDVFFRFGPVHTVDQTNTLSTDRLEKEMQTLLNAMDQAVKSGQKGKLIFQGKNSINR